MTVQPIAEDRSTPGLRVVGRQACAPVETVHRLAESDADAVGAAGHDRVELDQLALGAR